MVYNSTQVESNSEVIGMIAAMVILVISFGTFVAMGLPIITALFGLAVGSAGNMLLSHFTTVGSVSPTVATMIGLGVGIDYALFLVTRHRTNLDNGMEPKESVSDAVATAGSAVVLAGFTVVIALLGLQLVGIPYVGSLGYISAIVVAVMVLAALTVLPALLGALGYRINKLRVLKMRPRPNGSPFWRRRAKTISRRPKAAALTVVVIMGALALPALDMRLGQPDNGTKNTNTTQRTAYDRLATAFGPGFNGPLTIVVNAPDAPALTGAATR